MLTSKVEFFDREFFQKQYLRLPPSPDLRDVVDFYWQTKYSEPEKFSVRTFPRLGATIVVPCSSGFLFTKGGTSSIIESNVCYSRNESITTVHASADSIFGVQLKVTRFTAHAPIITEPATTMFSERENRLLREAETFTDRAGIVNRALLNLLDERTAFKASAIGKVLCYYENNMERKYQSEDWADLACCSSKTLERYFIDCCSTTPKQALKLIQVRKAVSHFIKDHASFDYYSYGYYDRSHFHKDLSRLIKGKGL